jgi:PmbA protein
MDILNEARKIADIAKKNGAMEYEVYISSNISSNVSAQDNNLHNATSDISTSVGIRVINNGSLGFSSINSLEESKVAKTIEEAISISKLAPPDTHNVLPEPQPVIQAQGIYDEKLTNYPLSSCITHVQESLERAKSFDKRIAVESMAFNVNVSQDAIVSSKGIELSQKSTNWISYLMGMAVDGDKVSTFDIGFNGGTSSANISLEKIVDHFSQSVVNSLGATQGESFTGQVILHPETLLELFVEMIGYMASAESIQTGASRLAGQLGKKVFSENLTVTDDGTTPNRITSMTFDREGITPKPLNIIVNGIFTNMLHNSRTAHREGASTNGRAMGSASSPPRIGPTGVVVLPGKVPLDQIIADTKQGLLVKRYSGNVDPSSGNFSGTVKGGWLIKNGKLDRPVTGTMIAGNLFDTFNNVSAVSSDTIDLINTILPYIRCEGVSVTSGK